VKKLIEDKEKIHWTRHVRGKMRYYRLSETRLKRVLRKPDRKELGVAPRTVAIMQITGTRKRPTEIWLMYQKPPPRQKRKAITIISAWRYPARSKKGKPPPIPEDILWEIEKLNEDKNSK
jgi:hypothetical protein